MPKVELTMEQTKVTKGTVVFTETARSGPELEEGERPHAFYLMKDTVAELGNPDQIKVTIEAE